MSEETHRLRRGGRAIAEDLRRAEQVAASESPSLRDEAPEPCSPQDSPRAQSPLVRAQQVDLEMRVSFLHARPSPSPSHPLPIQHSGTHSLCSEGPEKPILHGWWTGQSAGQTWPIPRGKTKAGVMGQTGGCRRSCPRHTNTRGPGIKQDSSSHKAVSAVPGNEDGRLFRPRGDLGTDVQMSLRSRGMRTFPARAARGRLPGLRRRPRGRAPASGCSWPPVLRDVGTRQGGQPASPRNRQLLLTDDNSALQKQAFSQGSVFCQSSRPDSPLCKPFRSICRKCFSGRLVWGAEGPHWEGSRENRSRWAQPPAEVWRLEKVCACFVGEPQTSHPHASSPEEQHHRQDPLLRSDSLQGEPGVFAVTSPPGLSQGSG